MAAWRTLVMTWLILLPFGCDAEIGDRGGVREPSGIADPGVALDVAVQIAQILDSARLVCSTEWISPGGVVGRYSSTWIASMGDAKRTAALLNELPPELLRTLCSRLNSISDVSALGIVCSLAFASDATVGNFCQGVDVKDLEGAFPLRSRLVTAIRHSNAVVPAALIDQLIRQAKTPQERSNAIGAIGNVDNVRKGIDLAVVLLSEVPLREPGNLKWSLEMLGARFGREVLRVLEDVNCPDSIRDEIRRCVIEGANHPSMTLGVHKRLVPEDG